ncbi:MAG TPA: winged helix-turn-helix transcriptional regulator [Solirubrobacterales bacterium]|nr:winged helix-turn-helix transcriptional regulator [Solirubrobacterales bacterium]
MPLNVAILRALIDDSKQQAELRRATGSPAQTTLRAQLKRLVEIDAIEKHRRNRFPGILEYELTESGHGLIVVADVLERWLRRAPEGPLGIESNAAKAAIKALAVAWSSTMLRALAAGPLSLTELDRVIVSLSYPALERRLTAMRLSGQLEASRSCGRGTPYAVTGWLRHGIAPLAVAARWERQHIPHETTPIGRLDVETAFLLTVPMLRPPQELYGSCRLAAEIANGKRRRLAGVVVEVEGGAIGSCTTNLDGNVAAWALGNSMAWLNAVIEGGANDLELSGDHALARALIGRLHEALFGTNRILALDSDGTIEEDKSN